MAARLVPYLVFIQKHNKNTHSLSQTQDKSKLLFQLQWGRLLLCRINIFPTTTTIYLLKNENQLKYYR